MAYSMLSEVEWRIFPKPKLAGMLDGSSFKACLKYFAAFYASPALAWRVAKCRQAPKCS